MVTLPLNTEVQVKPEQVMSIVVVMLATKVPTVVVVARVQLDVIPVTAGAVQLVVPDLVAPL